MELPELNGELIGVSAASVWGAIWAFHRTVIVKDFERVDDEVNNLKDKVELNTSSLSEIKGKLVDTKISLAKIEENSKFMYDSLREMKNEVKVDIFNLYEKIEALLKNK